MRVAIIGDSFTQNFKNTWIELLCTALDLKVVYHVGHGGHSQFKVYQSFLEVINLDIDVIIYVQTERSRLYNNLWPLNTSLVFYDAFSSIIGDLNIKKAANQYYSYLYDDDYAKINDKLLIKDVQEQCKKRNVKLINIPAFDHDHLEKNYGLWILVNFGLNTLCRVDYEKYTGKRWGDGNFQDSDRINHFSPLGHKILAENIIPHIKAYIDSDQEFHIALLFPELFA